MTTEDVGARDENDDGVSSPWRDPEDYILLAEASLIAADRAILVALQQTQVQLAAVYAQLAIARALSPLNAQRGDDGRTAKGNKA